MLRTFHAELPTALELKQCRYGPMLFLTTDQYIGGALNKYGEFSEGEVYFFRQFIQPSWTVIDAGANHGTHTVALAQMVGSAGTVYAFEPQRTLFQLICANLALNGLSNADIRCAGLGKECGVLQVPPVDYTRPNNFGAVEMGCGDIKVPLLTIDSLDLPSLHFAKIDAEGMEGEIVDGALKTIERCRPLLYMENDREDQSPKLIQKMWDLDYDLYFHLPYYYNRYNYSGTIENIYGGTISVNMFCVPRGNNLLVPIAQNLIRSTANTWRDFV